jgi:hypothetical protein
MDDFDKLQKLIEQEKVTPSQAVVAFLKLVETNSEDFEEALENVEEDLRQEIIDLKVAINEIPDPNDGIDGKDGVDGKDGKPGKDGKDGRNGLDGKDGLDGADGKDGKDGSPDTPEEVRDKLETLEGEERLDAKYIKNLPKASSRPMLVSGGAPQTPINNATKTVTADYSITRDDNTIFADATVASFDVTLPDATINTGIKFSVKNTSTNSNTITVDVENSGTIETCTEIQIYPPDSLTFVSDGTEWNVI